MKNQKVVREELTKWKSTELTETQALYTHRDKTS